MSRPTPADFRRAARTVFLKPQSPLTPAVVDRPTSNSGMQIEAAGVMGDLTMRAIDDRLSMVVPSKAKGDGLDELMWDLYQTVRKGASPSYGTVEISRQNTNAGAIVVEKDSIIEAGGITITTMDDAAFGPADLGPITVSARSSKAGATQTVTAGTPAKIKSYASLGVLANIPADFAGADDAESDEDFLDRSRTYWKDSRSSTIGAIEKGLIAVPGVHLVTVEEEIDSIGVPTGYVYAWVSDRYGRSNTALADAAKSKLNEYRSCGTPVFVYSASAVFQPISIVAGFRAGVNQIQLAQNVRNAMVVQTNKTRPRITLRLATLHATLERFVPAGLVINENSIINPLGDVIPTGNQIIRTRLDLVTVNA